MSRTIAGNGAGSTPSAQPAIEPDVEADDVMASGSEHRREHGADVAVVSGEKNAHRASFEQPLTSSSVRCWCSDFARLTANSIPSGCTLGRPRARWYDDPMRRSVILGAARTPFGKFGGGSLRRCTAVDLGGHAIRTALERSGIPIEDVEYVIMGQVLQAGVGQIPSRQAQIAAGLPREVGSETINKVCASGLRAVAVADQMIRVRRCRCGCRRWHGVDVERTLPPSEGTLRLPAR